MFWYGYFVFLSCVFFTCRHGFEHLLSTYGPVCVLLLADQYDVIIYYVREVLSVIQSPSISKYDTYYVHLTSRLSTTFTSSILCLSTMSNSTTLHLPVYLCMVPRDFDVSFLANHVEII